MDPLADLVRPAALYATPLLMAAAGETVVERAGVVNIGIEGMMLAGALAAWAANGSAGAAWGPGAAPLAGFAAAVAAAAALGLVFALAVLRFATDQIVAGTGINLLAFGGTALLYKRLDPVLADMPVTLTSEWWMAAGVLLLAGLTWAYYRYTRRGLEAAALGESPEAADAAGVPVNRRRLSAVLFGAACAGLAGAYLSTMRAQRFVENMTEGQGFLALAIVIFGRWRPPAVLAAGAFFGVVYAGAAALELRSGLSGATTQLLKIVPYAVSLVALAGLAGRSGAPAALGRPWARE